MGSKTLTVPAGARCVDTIKHKNDDDFVPMSEAAGIANGGDGVVMAGALRRRRLHRGQRREPANSDAFNTFFAKIERRFRLANDSSWKAFLQYTEQRSVADDLIGEFKTGLLAGKVDDFWTCA